jgi:ketosteroid isomerase-like protein
MGFLDPSLSEVDMPRLPFALMLLLLAACSPRLAPGDSAGARSALMAADRAFAAETAARGLDGWMDYYAADAVRLTMAGTFADTTIVQGHGAVRRFDAGLFADPSTRLLWEPTDAGVFADGRTGFTTGRSAFVRLDGGTPADTLFAGRYVTIWRRGADGRWRVILDTGS